MSQIFVSYHIITLQLWLLSTGQGPQKFGCKSEILHTFFVDLALISQNKEISFRSLKFYLCALILHTIRNFAPQHENSAAQNSKFLLALVSNQRYSNNKLLQLWLLVTSDTVSGVCGIDFESLVWFGTNVKKTFGTGWRGIGQTSLDGLKSKFGCLIWVTKHGEIRALQ